MGKDKKSKISLFFLLSYIVLIPLINGFMKILEKCFNTNLNTIDINFLNLFTVIFRNGTIFIIWVILNLIIILVAKNISTTKQNAKIEVEGVNLKKKDGTFGTADWGNKQEIQEYLSIGKRDGIILGETDEQEIITLPMNTYLNKNIAVFGSSGSMKTIGFLITNLLELFKYKKSIIVTDAKGEIYRKTSNLFRDNGYVVKVFNLNNMAHSDRWNPLGENEDITDIQTSSNVIISGTQKKTGKDDFWPRAEENLLKAFEFYFMENKLEQNTLTDIYKIIASGDIATLDTMFKRLPQESPARMSYNIFASRFRYNKSICFDRSWY